MTWTVPDATVLFRLSPRLVARPGSILSLCFNSTEWRFLMETIRGRKPHDLDLNEFRKQLASYDRVLLDLGTGDGRYARTLAGRFPGWFVIGLDSCRENLREHSQAKLKNLLFVIASAQSLPK